MHTQTPDDARQNAHQPALRPEDIRIRTREEAHSTRYVVFVRQGGKLACQWNRLHGSFVYEVARQRIAEMEKMGFKAVMHDLAEHETVNLTPVGWESDDVNWSLDYTEITPNGSSWVSHRVGFQEGFVLSAWMRSASEKELAWYQQLRLRPSEKKRLFG